MLWINCLSCAYQRTRQLHVSVTDVFLTSATEIDERQNKFEKREVEVEGEGEVKVKKKFRGSEEGTSCCWTRPFMFRLSSLVNE